MVMLATCVACRPGRNMDGVTDSGRSGAQGAGNATQAAAGTGSNEEAARRDSATAKVTVLFFGTSLTAGLGLDPSQAFPALIAAKSKVDGIPINAVNAGLSGETSAGALRRIDWTLKRPADVVVLETGGNDALRALDAVALRANLDSIVGRIQKVQPRARIILAMMEAPPNLGTIYTTRFSEAYSDVAKEKGLKLLPFLLDGVAGRPELNQDDGVHPNVAGEKIVADNVWRGLKPVVAELYAQKARKSAN
jgi:acyl-CoA thioesterase I